MNNDYLIECPSCLEKNDVYNSKCKKCLTHMPKSLNVRMASVPAEVRALERRYISAKLHLTQSGLSDTGDFFEEVIKKNGKALINTQANFIFNWLLYKKVKYLSYQRQVEEKVRPRAKYQNDIDRSFADSFMFGSVKDIIYSVLSIDDIGLVSYGAITVILKKTSIKDRTSALQNNSFPFIAQSIKDGWTFRTPKPPGYVSDWENVYKLSLAKLYLMLTPDTGAGNISQIIMRSTGDRATDDFIELYIYDNIAVSAIEKIKVPKNLSETFKEREKLQFGLLKKKYAVEEY